MNLGAPLTTASMRYLIRQAQPDAAFHDIDMMRRDAEIWGWAQSHADSLVICGNPRFFGPGGRDLFWGLGFWPDVMEMRQRGIPVADISPGVHLPAEGAEERLLQLAREDPDAQYVLACERALNLVLPRDRLFAAVGTYDGQDYPVMPDAAWWAARAMGVDPTNKTIDAISVRIDNGLEREWVLEVVRQQRVMAERQRTVIIVQTEAELAAMREIGAEDVVPCTDAAEFLRLMAHVGTLVSLRVHSSIPALAVGVRVLNLRLDSRSAALDEFGVQSRPLEILREPTLPLDLAQYGPSDAEMSGHLETFLTLWKEHMQR